MRRQKLEAVEKEDYDRAMELKELEKQLQNRRLSLFSEFRIPVKVSEFLPEPLGVSLQLLFPCYLCLKQSQSLGHMFGGNWRRSTRLLQLRGFSVILAQRPGTLLCFSVSSVSLKAIASRLEAIALRLEAIATRKQRQKKKEPFFFFFSFI